MVNNIITIWVEGVADQKFIGDLIRYWFDRPVSSLDNKSVLRIGPDGYPDVYVRIPKVRNKDGQGGHSFFSTQEGFRHIEVDFKNNLENGYNLIIADSDDNFDNRKNEIKAVVIDLNFDVEHHLFLWPFNKQYEGHGDIEVVLERIVADEHKNLLSCFETYEKCLKDMNKGYLTPDLKAKIYSYAQALTGKGNEGQRDYTNPTHWRLDPSTAPLKPLYNFLKEHIS